MNMIDALSSKILGLITPMDQVKVVNLADKVSTAVERYKSSKIPAVMVTDALGALKGLITSSDLTKLVSLQETDTVDKLATTQVIAISQDAELWQLLKLMNGENSLGKIFDTMPVVDKDTKNLMGVITRETLRKALDTAPAA